jgi:hypothetical protein
MKELQENRCFDDDETVELDIEDLTDIIGGVEDDEVIEPIPCGLGCFIGIGSGVL